jgi:uncharacterized membrane protein
MSNASFALILFAAVATGLMAGVFFAFSNFVMQGLSRLPPREGILAMQAINLRAPRSLFGALFLVTSLASAVLVILAIFRGNAAGGALAIAGGVFYVAGAFVVTMICNVPRNDALAKADPETDAAKALWSNYIRAWTAWNHVRTVASLAGMTAFLFAFRNL